ncbi:hypothetical protein PTKIN_Ptkin19aG0060900 [Pterospermum kingtungense]
MVNSEEVAYDLYKDYGHGIGFSIRKGRNRYIASTKTIRSKDLYCSKQGFKDVEDVANEKKFNKLDTRTGCPAMEFLDGIGLIWKEIAVDYTIHTFEVMKENSSRLRTFQFNTFTLEIHCSCKKFEYLGCLCSHYLRILSVKNVKKISEQYILKRWTKDAKKKVHGDDVGVLFIQYNAESTTVFRNRMIRFAYDFIIKSQENERTRQLCQRILYEGDLEVEQEFAKLCVNKDNEVRENETKASSMVM